MATQKTWYKILDNSNEIEENKLKEVQAGKKHLPFLKQMGKLEL
jgi:hypothetical protein